MATRAPNATAATLLGLLCEGPMSGWDLARTAEATIGDFWSLTRSQVYRELERMADQGLVEAGPPQARNRRPYEITEVGEAAFAEWINNDPAPEQIRFPLLLTVAFGRHLPPERLWELIEQHRSDHLDRLRDYERQHEEATAPGMDPDPFALATLEFGIAYERALKDWFETLPRRLPR
jgi:DNA-binding PadR family transcriptional regulator